MKENYNTRLIGKKVHLVPYREHHVKQYHEWMKNPYLLEMTASEPLSIEEEYEMQQTWYKDEMKCTFILIDVRKLDLNDGTKGMIGDVNIFKTIDEDRGVIGEIEIMIAEENARRLGIGTEALFMMMEYGITKFGIEIFIAKIIEDNIPSIRLFEKIGFSKIGYTKAFREYIYEFDTRIEENRNKIREETKHVIQSNYE